MARLTLLLYALVAVMISACSHSSPLPAEPGIARDLASFRKQRIAQLSYHLSFDLVEGSEAVAGRADLRFVLDASNAGDPVVLDFAGESIDALDVNGRSVSAAEVSQGNHLTLPAALFRIGETNSIKTSFRSRVAKTGTALTRYVDAADQSEWLYTLLVPADAHTLFPCFDQPDLKAKFHLSLTTPSSWRAVSNGEALSQSGTQTPTNRRAWEFEATEALSTYLFAFAAGPFAEVFPQAEVPEAYPLRILVRPSKLEHLEADVVFDLHRRGLKWQQEWFGYDYPFKKLDIVLCPGFPYGGMEHAGAIFYRETGIVFDHPATEPELIGRSSLIHHEVSHQWFGNLVTMEWFDDLWLKEGFATFCGYKTMAALQPELQPWLRFTQRVKPRAMRIDVTDATTPILQDLSNLADAKSAYGPIVYNKAPVVLRALEDLLGESTFKLGVQNFLKKHAFGNAKWSDLLAALSEASNRDLSNWSQRWILDRGMPRVSIQGPPYAITQEDTLGQDRQWPLRVGVLMRNENHRDLKVACDFNSRSHHIEGAAAHGGKGGLRWLLPDPSGLAFVQPRLDPRSALNLLADYESLESAQLRNSAFRALWESVRGGTLAPEPFARAALHWLKEEHDPQSFSDRLGALRTCLRRFSKAALQSSLNRELTELLWDISCGPSQDGRRLLALRAYARTAREEASLARLNERLDDRGPAMQLPLGKSDRFLLLAALIANQYPGAEAKLQRMSASGQDVAKYVFLVQCARPTPEAKAAAFREYQSLDGPPEQWVSGSLSFFHWPGQEELTFPYLEQALELAPWVKQHRKIFFMPAWLEGFVAAHSSADAVVTVQGWLDRTPELSEDIRRKLALPLHELQQAVAVRGQGAR